ncbi:hypothetical protein SNOG_02557 [Parastagonospora nodorum SN15]|uniref:Uncharacterized protein n=1 Tax=Phaeosphaeria nodorum (strain SN15 / ATCC MYA-4574 / FGSC 10173) TaxID=321614 RepID=Q0V0A7_PHANO|nr:hypothetical protein SNOG_02557 [Parastagonospora nodorum SN15]EAT90769.1 hypothetical protein SNOG_02557 [Parastagonospora nodorum SN15]
MTALLSETVTPMRDCWSYVSLLRVCHASKSSLVSTCFFLHDRSRYGFGKYQDAVSPQWRCQRPTASGMPKQVDPGHPRSPQSPALLE